MCHCGGCWGGVVCGLFLLGGGCILLWFLFLLCGGRENGGLAVCGCVGGFWCVCWVVRLFFQGSPGPKRKIWQGCVWFLIGRGGVVGVGLVGFVGVGGCLLWAKQFGWLVLCGGFGGYRGGDPMGCAKCEKVNLFKKSVAPNALLLGVRSG